MGGPNSKFVSFLVFGIYIMNIRSGNTGVTLNDLRVSTSLNRPYLREGKLIAINENGTVKVEAYLKDGILKSIEFK